MEFLFSGPSLVEAEPYILGFVAGAIFQRLYVVNKWRFDSKKKEPATNPAKQSIK